MVDTLVTIVGVSIGLGISERINNAIMEVLA